MFEYNHAWNFVIGDKEENCAANMKQHNVGEIVYLWNNTLQLYGIYHRICHYEIDLDRTDVDWVEHLSHKTWADQHLLDQVESAINKAKNLKAKAICHEDFGVRVDDESGKTVVYEDFTKECACDFAKFMRTQYPGRKVCVCHRTMSPWEEVEDESIK